MALEIKDPTKLPKEIIVFYSWQSHTDKKLNLWLIEGALEAAIEKVQGMLDPDWKCTIKFDRDTRERAGTVEIANTILEKIRKATIVVADVTAVLSSNDGKEHYPNPNVMMELGYAARALGWNRLVGVCNEVGCSVRQLPFDIAHRRLTPYRCSKKEEIVAAKKELTTKLVDAITAILTSIGQDEIDPSLGSGVTRRNRDVRLLGEVLQSLDTDAIKDFIDEVWEGRIEQRIMRYHARFMGIMSRSTSRFNDAQLEQRIQAFKEAWQALFDITSVFFFPRDKRDGYRIKDDAYWTKEDYDRHKRMEVALGVLEGALTSMVEYVSTNYHELDLRETNQAAREAVDA